MVGALTASTNDQTPDQTGALTTTSSQPQPAAPVATGRIPTVADYVAMGYPLQTALMMVRQYALTNTGSSNASPLTTAASTPSPYVAAQGQRAQELQGGALSQQLQLINSQQDKAAADKMAAILQARAILQQQQQNQTTNLPLLAAAGALGQPTRSGSFAESLGNAISAAVPATERQRQIQMQQAQTLGNLGVSAADVEQQQAKDQEDQFFKRQNLAQEAGQGAAYADNRYNIAGMNDATRLTNNQTTNDTRLQTTQMQVDARNAATALRGAYDQARVALGNRAVDVREQNNLAMQAVRQKAEEIAGRRLSDTEWNQYQTRINGVANNLRQTIDGSALNGSDLYAAAIAQVPPPAFNAPSTNASSSNGGFAPRAPTQPQQGERTPLQNILN